MIVKYLNEMLLFILKSKDNWLNRYLALINPSFNLDFF